MRQVASLVSIAALLHCARAEETPFQAWKREHGKHYKSDEDEARGMAAFVENDAFISAHRATSYTLSHNAFSDVPWGEFRLRYLRNLTHATSKPATEDASLFMMRGGVDWQARGAVTPVRNQGACGSCWAFSATEAIEGNLVAEGGELTELSPEFLVDCDAVDHGCQGGTMEQAFEFVVKRGICTDADDPYTGGNGRCRCTSRVFIDDYARVGQTVDQLTRAVVKTPVSVSIEADSRVFQFYSGGIIESKACGTNLDHGVLLVGFGFEGDASYWRIKNSWGTGWGEKGYVRIERNDDDVCGITQDASYPMGARATSPIEMIQTADRLVPEDDDEVRAVLGRIYDWFTLRAVSQ